MREWYVFSHITCTWPRFFKFYKHDILSDTHVFQRTASTVPSTYSLNVQTEISLPTMYTNQIYAQHRLPSEINLPTANQCQRCSRNHPVFYVVSYYFAIYRLLSSSPSAKASDYSITQPSSYRIIPI